jgi:hypothetical protein
MVIKQLGAKVKRPKMLLCYNYQSGINDEEYIIFATKPKLFSIGTINPPNKF